MNAITRIKGMQDVLPETWQFWDHVINTATTHAHRFGFERFDIPVMEKADLFVRGVGTASDVFVQKEMYIFEDNDGSNVALRPEFTAGVARAYLQNGMANWQQPVKLFLVGPIFRHENPQAGRYRQHTQFNAEIIGEIDPAADVEAMMLAMNICSTLGYAGLKFQLNSTGCRDCRPAYVEKLTAYLNEHVDSLAQIDRERLAKNPLRVLDSKEEGMDALLADAPHLADNLCEDCQTHFDDLRSLLDAIDQPYLINFRLVRGFDYYEKTVFEVWAEGIGSQSAICGGGRYDMTREIGGHSVPSVGFGMGIERMILGLQSAGIEAPPTDKPRVMVTHFGGETKMAAHKLAFKLRAEGIGARLAFARNKRSMKSQMREANKRGAEVALILGEDEIANDQVMARPLTTDEQQALVNSADLLTWLQARL